jgi:hypothetical protein
MDTQALQDSINLLKSSLSKAPVIDSASIVSHYGAIRGGTQKTNQLGISVLGPAVPQNVVTNSSNPTGSTTNETVTGANAGTTQTQVSATNNTQSAVQTNAAVTPAAATLPTAPSQTLPAGSVSASDIMDEQMQVSYQIAALEMLLTGALSDRYIRGPNDSLIPKVVLTVGLPLTIGIPIDSKCKDKADCRLKDAVAVVTAKFTPNTPACKAGDKSSVTVLQVIPSEKTYNTVALTNASTSVGAGGIIGGVVSVGGSFLHSSQTYYVLKQQDTVAMVGPTDPDACNAVTTIEWQFRPLAGKSYVQDGPRTVYAELAFPAVDVGQPLGTVTYDTSWHIGDRISGALGPPIPGFKTKPVTANLYSYASAATVRSIIVSPAQNGQAVTHIDGTFTPGTQVRLGNTIYAEGTNLIRSDKNLEFSAPIADLMAYTPVFQKRDGSETEISLGGTNGTAYQALNADAPKLALDDIWYEPQTSSSQRVTIFATETAVDPVKGACPTAVFPESPLVAQINNTVYGLDPQNTRYQEGAVAGCTRPVALSFTVSDADLGLGAIVRVRRLYGGSDYDFRYDLALFNAPIEPVVAAPMVNLLSHDAHTVAFSVQGRDIVPTCVLNAEVLKGLKSQQSNLLIFSVSRSVYDSLDNLVVKMPSGELLTLSMPPISSPPGKPAGKKK